LPSIGPKAQPFAQPRATPWGTGKRRFFSAQRANGSPRGKANFWPVGPTAQQKNGGRSLPQGVALGWANGWPFGPKSIVFSKIERSGTRFPDDPELFISINSSFAIDK
jgi:hypothetical protein